MKHKKFHFAEAREKFKCTVCGRGFRDSTKLKVVIPQLKKENCILIALDIPCIRSTRTYIVAYRTYIVVTIVRNRFVLLHLCTRTGKRLIQMKSSIV